MQIYFARCSCGNDVGLDPEDLHKADEVSCWNCGAVVDTRLKAEGGQAYEMQIDDPVDEPDPEEETNE